MIFPTSEVLRIHERMIAEYGGASGVRDQAGMESALARPFATFDGVELLGEPVEKAAAIIESILINHPYVDGNKRTGYVLMRLILLYFGWDIRAEEDDKYHFVISVASGQWKYEQILEWLKEKLVWDASK